MSVVKFKGAGFDEGSMEAEDVTKKMELPKNNYICA
jgi:hypothetical protein